jgi:hypothetical protein
LQTDDQKEALRDRLRKIAEEIAAYPDTGKQADKEFFDDPSGH